MDRRDRAVAAALALTFDDRHLRRHLALRHPAELERARLALAHLERRQARVVGDSPAQGAQRAHNWSDSSG